MDFSPFHAVRAKEMAFKMPYLLKNSVFQSFLARRSYFFAVSSLQNAFETRFWGFLTVSANLGMRYCMSETNSHM
jgi:hypothetical protein